jgi:succinoglycan biosynthesis protein ExoV
MKLYQWRGSAPNFGDELNGVLWPRLLPGAFDDNPGTLFLGIGSILDGRHPAAARKLVAGAGYGGYEPPAVLDPRWDVRWVRGPRTARLLGLPPTVGLGDPAVLLPLAGVTAEADGGAVGFMPHFESAGRGAWDRVATACGVTLIDPRGDPLAVLRAIATCRLLLSESLHGVIAADAMRVPWIAIEPLAAVHRPKWHDWADTVGVSIAFRRVPASSLAERLYASPLAGRHLGRALVRRHESALHGVRLARFVDRAVSALARAAGATPQLSAGPDLQRCQDRMLQAVAVLRRELCSQPAPCAGIGNPHRTACLAG